MAIRGVVFDKDGTLFDFQATWAGFQRRMIGEFADGDPAREAALAEALDFDLETGRFRPGSVVVAETAEVVAERISPLLPGRSARSIARRLDEAAAGIEPVAVPGLPALLDRLAQAGLALGVATNDGESAAVRQLRAAGVADRFGFLAGYDSGWGAKPGPGQLLAFAAHAGLDPAEALMVGDSLHDLLAARAAGMPAVAVLTGVARRAELAPAAEAVLPSVADLPDWLGHR